MPGKIISLVTSDVFTMAWGARELKATFNWKAPFWTKGPWHTYVMIFSTGGYAAIQQQMLDLLKKQERVKILFEGVKAVNTTPGHGNYPRNVLVIFELKRMPKPNEPV